MRWIHASIILMAAACGPAAKPPAANDSHAAAAPAPAPAPDIPLPLSRFSAPLDYDFSAVLGVVERVVPTTFGSIDSVHQMGDDTRRHYAYEAKRDRFTAFADGPLVHLRATLSYRVRGYYKPVVGPTVSAGCGDGDTPPRIVIELVTPLTLTSSWHLASRAALAGIAPASSDDRDRCKASIFRRDITERVVESARAGLVKHLSDIDKKIASVDLRGRFEHWWTLLERPIRITNGVWLVLQPERLRVGRIGGKGTVLTVEAGLDARPRIVTGGQPIPRNLPLPSLARDSASSGFRILLDGAVDYATATHAVTDALHGKVVTEGGRRVVIDSVIVSPTRDNRLTLTVSFVGDTRGRLRLVGRPRFDAVQRTVAMPDLDFALETDDGLVNAYAWVRSDALRKLFRERARVPETVALDRANALLTAGLNRTIGGVMTLSARVDSVAVVGVFVTPAALVARGEARGRGAVSIRQR